LKDVKLLGTKISMIEVNEGIKSTTKDLVAHGVSSTEAKSFLRYLG
jgi:hypothetical protein